MTAAAVLTGLQAGLWHPLTVPAHVLALIGLGLTIAQQSRRGVLLTAFAVGLIAGLVALASATAETPALTVLLAATVLAGLAAASAWPLPLVVGAPLAVVIGAAIGLDSPPRVASIAAADAALAGTALSAFVMLGLVTAIAARLGRAGLRIATRILGSWIAASAILVVTLQLAR